MDCKNIEINLRLLQRLNPFLFNYNFHFQDCRETIDYVHMDSMELKKLTVADLPRYVKKNSCLLRMLRNIKDGGKKSFLLTNSDWWYTQIIMKYLLNDENSDEG